MPITKLQFSRPGINTQDTQYGAEGGWTDCDNVRFRYGFPEKLGGWADPVGSNLIGVGRGLFVYTSLGGATLAAIGTNKKLYMYYGTQYYDITPLSTTLPAVFNFTSGTTYVSVTSTSNGASVGDFVTFSSVSGVSVINITNAEMQNEFEIKEVTSTDVFKIDVTGLGTPGTVTTSGSAAGAAFQIDVGVDKTTFSNGWGVGEWSGGQGWGMPSGANIISDTARIWALDAYGEDLIATIIGGKTYILDTSVFITSPYTTRATLLTYAPTQSNYMIVSGVDRHLIFLGTQTTPGTTSTYDPMVVLFGAQESVTDFIPTAVNDAGFQRLTDGNSIVTAVRTRGDIGIFTNTSMHAMQYVGPPYTFSIKNVGSNCGIVGPHAAVEVNNKIYWMSNHTFFLYDGVVREIPCSVQNYVFNGINLDAKNIIYAGVNAEFSEINWFYPTIGSYQNNAVVTYNFREDLWTIGTLPRSSWHTQDIINYPLATEYFPNSTSNATPTIYGLSNGISTLYNHESGVNANGQAMTCFIKSGDVDIVDGNDSMFIKRYIPDFSNQTGDLNMKFYVKQYPGSSSTLASNTTVNSNTTKVDMRARGRQVAIEIGSTNLNSYWRFGTLRIDGQLDGLR
jgi:hypothetical protein